MKLIRFAVAVAALVFAACGIKVPPEVQDCRIFGCPDPSRPVCAPSPTGLYACREKAVDPCEGKTPICERNDSTDCWAMTADGKCTWFPKPIEPPKVCPAPPAEAPACPAGQVPDDPAWKCGSETDYAWVARCKAKPPEPEPACAVEEDLVTNEVQSGPQLQEKVADAMAALGDPTGLPPAETLERLAAKLRSGGLCAFAGSEAIFVRRSDGRLFEEYHAVSFANGGWTNGGRGKYIGVHRKASDVQADSCPFDPCPERTYPDGRPRWKYNAKRHTMGNGDSTPVVVNQLDYCRKVGLGDFNGTPRASCPVRGDGHPERFAVEVWLTEGGPTRDSRNGQDCSPNHTDNPAAFLFGTGNCRMCNRPKTVCSEWM